MICLALAGIRHRAAAFLATLVAVALGAALLIACGGLFETALRLDAPPQRLAGVPVVVTGPAGFALPDQGSQVVPYSERTRLGADIGPVIAAVPGVLTTVEDVSFPATAIDPAGDAGGPDLAGHPWSTAALTPYELVAGTEPQPGEVVLDTATSARAGVRPGDMIPLSVAGQRGLFRVAGVARPDHDVAGPAYFFAESDAARYAPAPGLVDAVGVFPAPGTPATELVPRLEAALPAGTSVLTGESRGAAEFPGLGAGRLPLILLSCIFGGMVAVVTGLVVSATVSLSVQQRLRELALLRATGATPRQVHRLVVAETAVVAVLGAALGVVVGRPVGHLVFSLTAARGVVPPALAYALGPLPFAAGVVLALLVPVAATAVVARTAAHTRPVQAMAEASLPPVRLSGTRRGLALAFAIATVGLALPTAFLGPDLGSAVGGPSVLTGVIAVGLYAPELVRRLAGRSAGVVRRLLGLDGSLAVTGVRARAVAYAAVLTPLTLSVSFALGNVYAQISRDDGAVDGYVHRFAVDAVVVPRDGAVARELLSTIRSTAGMASASALVTSRGWVDQPYDHRGSDPRLLVGIDAQDGPAVLAERVTAGSLHDLTGATVALPEDAARAADVGVGDQVRMRFGDGARADVRVVALLSGSSRYPALVLPASLLAPHTTSGFPSLVLVRAQPGADVQDALTGPDVEVGGPGRLESAFRAGLDVEAWINYLLAVLAIGYAAIASVNSLAVAVLSRRRELAGLRLAGAARAQVVRVLLLEAGIVAAYALVLGLGNALINVVPAAIGAGSVLPSGPPWVFLAVLVALAAIVVPVTWAAARLATWRRPLAAITGPAAG